MTYRSESEADRAVPTICVFTTRSACRGRTESESRSAIISRPNAKRIGSRSKFLSGLDFRRRALSEAPIRRRWPLEAAALARAGDVHAGDHLHPGTRWTALRD